ncbi:HEPN domain-containing protein [Streptomyces tirandamycinicus]|uniref:HEPN domain-containing protein n=1 Tax=Streptomyces tirandamycinicus TaxID=2174846 RepID=UPI00226F7798|nr:HEPN domain-containing protein [Streptomyces tirandamycinicus]MCY0984696.1 HEPN domain-containing protein [Streptomyces tirandamycinicus]
MGDVADNQEPLSPADELHKAAERLRRHAEYSQQIIDEAERRQVTDKRKGYFVGISGCILASESADSGIAVPASDDQPIFVITPVTNIPDLGSLSRALTPGIRPHYAHLSHLSRMINHELFISERIASTPQAALNVAYRAISLTRLKSNCLINAISFSRVPWGQVAAHTNDLVIQPLEEPRRALWESQSVITEDDLTWVVSQLARDFDLYEQPSYRLAYDSAADAPFLKDSRTAVARIWSGIESLFDVQNELSFRLSMYAAVLISDNFEQRTDIQARFKRLYTMRSKAVHGVKMDAAKLEETLVSSWSLLRDLLLACMRTGAAIPSTNALDRALLGHPLTRDDGGLPRATDQATDAES